MSFFDFVSIVAGFTAGSVIWGILRGKIFRPRTDCERGIHSPGPFKTFYNTPSEPRTPWEIYYPLGKRQSCTRCGKALVEQSYRFR